ncbi:MAG: hypothetical protein IK045_08975 [Bacteroidales bacterium]|nr:hypothetical protein [Bacteroidales bacterium]
MKKFAFLFFAAAFMMIAGKDAMAQGKFGRDSAECIKYLSYYQEYYKQKNYDSAIPNWRKAYAICPPTAAQKMFTEGSTLLTRVISKTKDASERAAVVDTLLTLQDTRLKYYPTYKGASQAPTILNNKGTYILNYKSADQQYVYNEMNKIINEIGPKARPNILFNSMQSSINLYKDGKLSADEVIENYNRLTAVLEGVEPKTDAEAEEYKKVTSNIQSVFVESKVASCENIIKIFTPRYEANPNDLATVTSIVKLMSSADNCLDNDLYLKAVTSMHKLDPSYKSAYFLYKLNSARDNYSAAIQYLQDAINFDEADAQTKSDYYLEMAVYALKNGQKAKAYDAARKAESLADSNDGKAYMLMGDIWMATGCGGNEITARAKYWVAADFYMKAKAADPSLAEDAGRKAGSCSVYYPATADAFMYDLQNGQSYTASCGGMTATTTVRTR